jgi:hypothetical protein
VVVDDAIMGWLIVLLVVGVIVLLVWRSRRRGSGDSGEIRQTNDPRNSPRHKPDLGPPY